MKAKFESACTNCGGMIEKGQEIEFESACTNCGGMIEKGQEIEKTIGALGYHHAECAEGDA